MLRTLDPLRAELSALAEEQLEAEITLLRGITTPPPVGGSFWSASSTGGRDGGAGSVEAPLRGFHGSAGSIR